MVEYDVQLGNYHVYYIVAPLEFLLHLFQVVSLYFTSFYVCGHFAFMYIWSPCVQSVLEGQKKTSDLELQTLRAARLILGIEPWFYERADDTHNF